MGEYDKRTSSNAPGLGAAIDRGVAPGRLAMTNYMQSPATGAGDYVDHRGVCDNGSGAAGCWLDDIARGRLVTEYQGRVTRAMASYQAAITRETIDTLMEHDDDLFWVATLVLGVATEQIGLAIGAALKTLRGRATGAISDIDTVAKMGSRKFALLDRIDSVSDDTIKTLGKLPADALKDKLKGTLKDRQNTQDKNDRDAATRYLDRLLEASAAIYERYAEEPPNRATDAELLVLFRSWNAEDHNPGVYRMLVRSAVDRYKASNAKRIGLQHANPMATIQKDTHVKVGWVKMGPNAKAQLMYLEQDFEAGDPAIARDDAERMEKPGATMDETPKPTNLVEDEFTNVAIERHMQLWGSAPKTYEYTLFPAKLREVGTSTKGELAGDMVSRAEHIKHATDVKLPGVKP